MLREIRPAIVVLRRAHAHHRPDLSAGDDRHRRRILPHQAQGSLIERDGKVVGSALIGQDFTSDKYFHGRPSATTAPDPNDATKTVPAPYNAANSGGSNLGPDQQGADRPRARRTSRSCRQENPSAPVPIDLVTTSASGLDPDISPEAA